MPVYAADSRSPLLYDTITGKLVGYTDNTGIDRDISGAVLDHANPTAMSIVALTDAGLTVAGQTPTPAQAAAVRAGAHIHTIDSAKQASMRVFFGQLSLMTQITANYTFSKSFAIRKPCKKVRLMFCNVDTTSTMTVSRASIAKLAAFPTTTASAINNVGIYTFFTFDGQASVTIPAATDQYIPQIAFTDWLEIDQSETTGSPYPMLTARACVTGAIGSTVTATVDSSTGWRSIEDGFTEWNAAVSSGDYVSSGGLPIWEGMLNGGRSAIVACETFCDPCYVVSAYGDSVIAGTNITTIGNSFLHKAINLIEEEGISCSLSNFAWPGRDTANALTRFNNEVTLSIPSASVFLAYSSNDGTPTKVKVDAAYARVTEFIYKCKHYGVVPIIMLPLLNEGWTVDGRQKLVSYRTNLRALSNAARILDFSQLLLTSDELEFLPDVSSDGVHPNDTGVEVVKMQAMEVIKAAFVGG